MSRHRSLPDLAERLEIAARQGRLPRLSAQTVAVVAAALRAYSTHPTRDEIVRALCTSKDGCPARTCWSCMGKANLIQRIYRGDAGPFEGEDTKGAAKPRGPDPDR